MWPFKSQQTPSTPQQPALEDQVRALSRELAEQRADLQLLRREWADTLDKLQSWFGREAARKRQQLHKQLETPETAPEVAGSTNGHQPISKAELRRIAAQRRFQGNLG